MSAINTTILGESSYDAAVRRVAYLSKDPALFLKHAVYTMDEADNETVEPKAFPFHYPYFQPLLTLWNRGVHIAVEKSRQLLISWFFAALHLHYTFTRQNRKVLLLSTTEEKAKMLLDRCEYMYDNMDEALWPSFMRPAKKRIATQMEFPDMNSVLLSLPSSTETARSITASRVFLDEFAHMSDVEELYQGVAGSTAGGGIITLVSTNPILKSQTDCLFWRLCDGRMEQ